jgi:hypothetical protein
MKEISEDTTFLKQGASFARAASRHFAGKTSRSRKAFDATPFSGASRPFGPDFPDPPSTLELLQCANEFARFRGLGRLTVS